MNWSNSRVSLAQAAVKLLMCHPEEAFKKGYIDKTTSDKLRARLTTIPQSYEAHDDIAACTESELNQKNERILVLPQNHSTKIDAINYARSFNFSLAQLKAQLADLQHLRNTRTLGVGVPV